MGPLLGPSGISTATFAVKGQVLGPEEAYDTFVKINSKILPAGSWAIVQTTQPTLTMNSGAQIGAGGGEVYLKVATSARGPGPR